jgi:UDP:flavonoid glycosyltransferase YjiC (YdhE family)
VLPYAALGRALLRAGHGVRLATFENFRDLVVAQGLDFRPIRGDARALLDAAGGLALGEAGQNILKQAGAIRRSFGRLAHSYGPDVAAAAQGGVDLILNQLPGALYGVDLAEALRVPMLMLAVMPLARTRAWPMLAFPARLGRVPGFNAFSYFVAEQLVWQMFRPAVNGWRKSLGLRPRPGGGYFRQLERQAVPVLNGFSPRVVPRPRDWPAHVHITGYWFPAAEAWQAPAAGEVRRFIEAGSPPVFIGFGSMPVREAAHATALLLEAVRLSGQRAVLHSGWGRLFQAGAFPDGTDAARLPEDVFLLDYAPFDWLFPQMAAVVHHGGSGTTGAGLRAGVPSVIVPFVMDQFFWGERVAALGAGPRPVPYAKLSATRLAGAIDQAVSDPEISRRAAALGRDITAEDGLGRAVALVEQALTASRPSRAPSTAGPLP